MTGEQRARAHAIAGLIRLGWSPPRPTDEQALRIIQDMHDLDRPRQHRTLELTDNEQDILARVALGKTVQEIADETCRSPETIKDSESRIRRKLGARNNAHAVAIYKEAA